jgi:uncharacterized protein (TIGR03437 family)
LALLTVGAGRSLAANFGTVVPLPGGTASDIALDERRGVLYIADFGAGTIDVMTLADNTIHSSINVAPFPVGIAMAPSGNYLVVVHYADYTLGGAGNSPVVGAGGNLATVINLNTLAQTTYAMGDSPLGVAFVNTMIGDQGGLAVIATTSEVMTLDPETGEMQVLAGSAALDQKIPQPASAPPVFFTQAAMGTSADGWVAWGAFGLNTGLQPTFWFNGLTGQTGIGGWITTPTLPGPVSVNKDGSRAMIGWAEFDQNNNMVAEYSNVLASKTFNGHAWDTVHNLIYAQMNDLNQGLVGPALVVMDADNLAYRDRLNIPENLVGRGVMNQAGTVMYAMSHSGVTVFPVGSLNSFNRLQPSQEDVLLQTAFCNQSQATQTFTLADPGGNATDFAISTSTTGIQVSPSSGVTPATITVTAAPAAFVGALGTSVATLKINSASAVNQPIPVRVLVSNPDADQRGTVVNVPGVLSDIVADPTRNRFYITRQDRNQVLVFDGSNNKLMTTLRTMTTPVGMALAPKPYTNQANKYLLVANADSQWISVFDLDTLQAGSPVVLPGSDFGRSIAVANNAILVLSADKKNIVGDVSVIDLTTGFATSLATLGGWANDLSWISTDSVLTASPNGEKILMAGKDGHVSLYDASRGNFTASMQDVTALTGAYAASSYGYYVVGNNILNSALAIVGHLGVATGASSSGFAFLDSNNTANGYFATSPAKLTSAGPGSIQYFPAMASGFQSPIPTVEATLLPTILGSSSPDGTVSNNGSGSNSGWQQSSFSRTVAVLPSGEIVELTTSGFTVLGPGYASAFQSPILKSITNAADYTAKVAPDGLVSVWGTGMSPVSIVASQVPLPTSLGESCLSVAGTPIPLIFVSPTQINAQLPQNVLGNETISLHTPGGVSNTLNFTVNSTAPAVFLSGVAGDWSGLATVIRAKNNQLVTPTNPIRINDTLVIWLTGMGLTTPTVDAGQPAPTDPLAQASSQPTVTLGGYKLMIDYAGMAPGEAGVYQINVEVPFGVPLGDDQPLVITQGTGKTTLNFRVVTN